MKRLLKRLLLGDEALPQGRRRSRSASRSVRLPCGSVGEAPREM